MRQSSKIGVKEAAKRLGRSPCHVRLLIRQGRIKASWETFGNCGFWQLAEKDIEAARKILRQ